MNSKLRLPCTSFACALLAGAPLASAQTILIDIGKTTQETALTGWNNYAFVTDDRVNAGDADAGIDNLVYSDGTGSSIDFTLTANSKGNEQGIAGADWNQDFSGTFGYPVSATRDAMFVFASASGINTATFSFSGLETDGTLYEVTVFGAFDPNLANRPPTNITIAGSTQSYDPNDPGQVTFTNLLPNGSGEISFTVASSSTSGPAFISVVSLTTIPEPGHYALMFGALGMGCLLLKRRKSQSA